MGADNIDSIGSTAGNAGEVVGKGGSIVGDFFTDFSLYIANMSMVEWILLFILIVGALLVWNLKNKYGLVFRWGPKKPKKSFN